ncbi:co-chaperone YbbN [Paenibacillus sp. FJAT-26967]|uniref:thioredoxin family protein n=1 Tax=Paenibacillus sp. FJAT-26967 TaxID=1729690 RepID=UPI000838B3D0|nr:thioredoxin family protein [Paenibacillus sp. FJAT-26967]
MSLVSANDATFKNHVQTKGILLANFGSPFCPPCRALAPVLEELQEEYSDRIDILKINCDDSPQKASDYGVMATPTVIVFHNGEPVEKLVGLRSKQVYQSVVNRYM